MVLKTVFCSTDLSRCLEAAKHSQSISEGIDIDGKKRTHSYALLVAVPFLRNIIFVALNKALPVLFEILQPYSAT